MLAAHEPSSVELPPGGGVPLHVLCGTRTAQLVGPVFLASIDMLLQLGSAVVDKLVLKQ